MRPQCPSPTTRGFQMYKRILAAVDWKRDLESRAQGSHKARQGPARCASAGSRGRCNARIHNNGRNSLDSIDAYQKSMRDAGRKVLAACAAKAKAGRVKFDTKFVVIAGLTTRIWEVINKDAKRWRADLIVIGTHGRRGIQPFVPRKRCGRGHPARGDTRLGRSRAMSSSISQDGHDGLSARIV